MVFSQTRYLLDLELTQMTIPKSAIKSRLKRLGKQNTTQILRLERGKLTKMLEILTTVGRE